MESVDCYRHPSFRGSPGANWTGKSRQAGCTPNKTLGALRCIQPRVQRAPGLIGHSTGPAAFFPYPREPFPLPPSNAVAPVYVFCAPSVVLSALR